MLLVKKKSDKNINENNSDENLSNPSFAGNKPSDYLAKGIGKILDNKSYQQFAKKNKDSNFPMHILSLKDILATTLFVHETNKSKKIKDERKPAIIYNSFISTGLSISSSYVIDKLTEKPAQKIVDKIKKANANEPIFILATVYYIAIPFISTFLAERAEKSTQSHNFIKQI